MPDDVLAGLRPEGGWSTAAPVEKPAQPAVKPEAAQATEAAGADDERWLLACIDRGHVRWRGDGTGRIAIRSCAHTDHNVVITGPVAQVLGAGLAERAGTPGANGGGITLTTDGRRRLADLERGSGG